MTVNNAKSANAKVWHPWHPLDRFGSAVVSDASDMRTEGQRYHIITNSEA